MLGAIAGDVIGSVYEHRNLKSTEFPLFREGSVFTDDSVLTVATAEALLTDGDYASAYRKWFRRYPNAGYGGYFRQWGWSEHAGPYDSFGNGSAMRVSPVAWACETLDEVYGMARASAEVTHNHPQGILGAQAVAATVFMARKGYHKQRILEEIEERSGYDLRRTLEEIRPGYTFDVSCQGSVPEAIIAFLESNGFEDAIRNAISIGGDSDTIACMAGSMAEACHGGVPGPIADEVLARLTPDLREVVDAFVDRYGIPRSA